MLRSSGTTAFEAARRPRDARRLGVGHAGSRACGNAIEVRVLLEEPHDTIAELSVVTRGHHWPGDPSALTSFFVGMSVEQALEVTHREIAVRLGGLPESRMYCSVLLHEALRAAVAATDPRANASEHPRLRRPCVTCRCFSVAEDLIRRAVRVNGLTSAEEVACYTRAGSGCGLCADGIASILSGVRRESQRAPSAAHGGPAAPIPSDDE